MRIQPSTIRLDFAQPNAPAALGIAAITLALSLAYAVAALPWDLGAPGLAALLARLGLSSEALAADRWHVLATHWLLHVGVCHLAITTTLLLTAGARVERALGTVRFVLLWAGGGCAAAAFALATGQTPMIGGTAAALAVAGAACCVDGRTGSAGGWSGRRLWIAVACVATGGLLLVELTSAPWHVAPQMIGLPVGVAAAAAGPIWLAWRHRRYLRRGLAELHAEHVVRERVDALLARIADSDRERLSRHERRFLRRASRFYASGRPHDVPAHAGRRSRTETPAPRPPAE